jgi:hypothetical protein
MASTSVPKVKTRPLISTTRRKSPRAGARARRRNLSATAVQRCIPPPSSSHRVLVHTGRSGPRMGVKHQSERAVPARRMELRRRSVSVDGAYATPGWRVRERSGGRSDRNIRPTVTQITQANQTRRDAPAMNRITGAHPPATGNSVVAVPQAVWG